MLNYGARQFVKLKGLNRRSISVETLNILYLEEHEIDGVIVTNIHFTNGRWVTAGLPLDEAQAMLSKDVINKDSNGEEEHAEQRRLDSWRRMAKMRAEAQKEINEALALIGPGLKSKSYTKEVMPDGSGKLVIYYEPGEEGSDV